MKKNDDVPPIQISSTTSPIGTNPAESKKSNNPPRLESACSQQTEPLKNTHEDSKVQPNGLQTFLADSNKIRGQYMDKNSSKLPQIKSQEQLRSRRLSNSDNVQDVILERPSVDKDPPAKCVTPNMVNHSNLMLKESLDHKDFIFDKSSTHRPGHINKDYLRTISHDIERASSKLDMDTKGNDATGSNDSDGEFDREEIVNIKVHSPEQLEPLNQPWQQSQQPEENNGQDTRGSRQQRAPNKQSLVYRKSPPSKPAPGGFGNLVDQLMQQ